MPFLYLLSKCSAPFFIQISQWLCHAHKRSWFRWNINLLKKGCANIDLKGRCYNISRKKKQKPKSLTGDCYHLSATIHVEDIKVIITFWKLPILILRFYLTFLWEEQEAWLAHFKSKRKTWESQCWPFTKS